ncbi:MAG: putative toxin-antitoxin system toxin component, PIN family [SAR324 cluster bacterium]|nr:putative toxin-antitoxin system toxin component, PIN family [SAR324 cluster bacterium]
MKSLFRIVPDTNVIISAQSKNPDSPNRELIERWLQDEFILLYSLDTLQEYFRKLRELNFAEEIIISFLADIRTLAERVEIEHYHFYSYQYPKDRDDIAFVLCAENGNATHLVTYDSDLLEIRSHHSFTICQTIQFLKELL